MYLFSKDMVRLPNVLTQSVLCFGPLECLEHKKSSYVYILKKIRSHIAYSYIPSEISRKNAQAKGYFLKAKKKCWEPFRIFLLKSTANPAHIHPNLAGLAVLFSRQFPNGSQRLFHNVLFTLNRTTHLT